MTSWRLTPLPRRCNQSIRSFLFKVDIPDIQFLHRFFESPSAGLRCRPTDTVHPLWTTVKTTDALCNARSLRQRNARVAGPSSHAVRRGPPMSSQLNCRPFHCWNGRSVARRDGLGALAVSKWTSCCVLFLFPPVTRDHRFPGSNRRATAAWQPFPFSRSTVRVRGCGGRTP